MTSALQALLYTIAAEQRAASMTVRSPASCPAIARVESWMRDRFAMPLPQALATLWAIHDGIFFDGMMFYRATESTDAPHRYSIMPTNETFAAVTGTRYLYIGVSDMDAYVYNTLAGGWHMSDKISLDSFERFETCEALVLAALRKTLEGA